MMKYVLFPAELFPLGEGIIKLETNKVYIKLLGLKQELEDARNSMEPYFQKHKSIFKSVTSGFGSFKNTQYHISKRFNTPSVSNEWIIMYEILSHFDLISKKDGNKKFIHFNSENLPGSTILASHHFIHTMRDKDFQFNSYWFSSAPLNIPMYKGDDICKLMQKYPHNWPMNIDSISPDSKKQYIPDGDVTNVNYSDHIKKWLLKKETSTTKNEPKICLFTGNICMKIRKYNSEELIYNKLFLGQLYLCCNILKIQGDAVLRNTTFFSLFNISLMAWISMHFKECTVYKPMSSKKESSEIYLICKGFKGASEEDLTKMKDILSDASYDYEYGQILRINKITKEFWLNLYNIANIFKNQIINIKNNIIRFNIILRKQNGEIEEKKMNRDSQKMFGSQAKFDNIEWGELYPVKPLHQNDWMDMYNVIESNKSYYPKTNRSVGNRYTYAQSNKTRYFNTKFHNADSY